MQKARRYNKGKTRFELIPQRPLKCLADVYTKGAHKYTIYKDELGNEIKGSEISLEESKKYEIVEDGADNWRAGLSWMKTIGSVKRHIEAFIDGSDMDEELGTFHLGNAVWGLFSILEYYKTHPELDDRNHKYLNTPRIGVDIDGVLADFTGHLIANFQIDNHTAFHWNDPVIKDLYEKVKEDENFWISIPSLTSQEDMPFEPACYVTSRSIDKRITEKWLDKHGFPRAEVISIGHDKSKVEVVKNANIDIFIDDKWENFVELNNAGICCFLYDQPYNRKHDVGFKRIKNLKEIFNDI